MDELLVTPAILEEIGTLILAHGAGAPMDSEFMNLLCTAFAGAGVSTVRFEFPYMRLRRLGGTRRPPDRQDVLFQCWRKVYSLVKAHHSRNKPLLIGGKSMGGRMASLMAEELQPDGFCCFGYPFIPPGKPEKSRTAHFECLTVPGVILQGSRDAFGKQGEVNTKGWAACIRLVWLEEGDHDYRARKASGLTQEGIIAKAANHTATFIKAL